MSGGVRYWNEETQRWEDDDGTRALSTPPPPARPGTEPPSDADGRHGPAAGGSGSGGWPATQVSAGGPAVRDPDAPAGDGVGTPAPPTPPVPPAHPAPAGPAPDAGAGAWPPAPWPPGDQVAAPARAGGMSRRTVWSVLIGAAAVGVAVSLVLTLVVRSGDDKKDDAVVTASSSPAVDVSRQGDPSGSPTPTEETSSPTPTPTASEVPAGYEPFEDPEGFRIVRPEGWTRSTVASQYGIAVVNYRSADSTRRLQVYQVAEESPDASFDLYLSEETSKPAGFEEVSLDNLDDPASGFTGSRLEYLADSIKGEPEVGTWHVYDERFVAQDGFIYAIAAYGPDANGGADELELLTTALAGFCAPYACDPASID
ncbi:hypothetical protein [Streptomyces lincolnensis]|uniref:hypothetical protein n=1 Tax=Streptomyces lincolnensis TaxID=1915 RepID=UPI000AFEBA0B|nr:hypothetical protein [Streptomyces lincolnensis]